MLSRLMPTPCAVEVLSPQKCIVRRNPSYSNRVKKKKNARDKEKNRRVFRAVTASRSDAEIPAFFVPLFLFQETRIASDYSRRRLWRPPRPLPGNAAGKQKERQTTVHLDRSSIFSLFSHSSSSSSSTFFFYYRFASFLLQRPASLGTIPHSSRTGAGLINETASTAVYVETSRTASRATRSNRGQIEFRADRYREIVSRLGSCHGSVSPWKFTFRWVNDNCTLIRAPDATRCYAPYHLQAKP